MATDPTLPCLPAAGKLCLLQLQREDEGEGKVRRYTKPENIIFEYITTPSLQLLLKLIWLKGVVVRRFSEAVRGFPCQ